MSTHEPGSARGPIFVIAGLAVVVISNAIMIGIAFSQPSIPATQDHWAESLEWEQELELRAHSHALGWKVREFARDGQALSLDIVDRQGQPLLGLRGSVTLRRADSVNDLSLALVEASEGRYRSEGAIPDAGLYELRVAVQDAKGERFAAQRWVELDALEPARAP